MRPSSENARSLCPVTRLQSHLFVEQWRWKSHLILSVESAFHLEEKNGETVALGGDSAGGDGVGHPLSRMTSLCAQSCNSCIFWGQYTPELNKSTHTLHKPGVNNYGQSMSAFVCPLPQVWLKAICVCVVPVKHVCLSVLMFVSGVIACACILL